MTGAAPQETPREPENIQPAPLETTALPEKPTGMILSIEGPQSWTWVDPAAIRPLPNFGSWHRLIMGKSAEDQEFAALDAMVVTLGPKAGIKPGATFHLEVPGNPPKYLKFQIESKDPSLEGAPKSGDDKEFVCLLLRATTGTAHPIALKEKAVLPHERMKGNFS